MGCGTGFLVILAVLLSLAHLPGWAVWIGLGFGTLCFCIALLRLK